MYKVFSGPANAQTTTSISLDVLVKVYTKVYVTYICLREYIYKYSREKNRIAIVEVDNYGSWPLEVYYGIVMARTMTFLDR